MKKEQPLVSIVITVYNAQDYVKHALESICNQTYTNWEAIIINNGSTDNTLSEMQSVDDKRIHIKTITNNNGLAKGRNLGIQKSQGAYIAIMDADDIMHKTRIEKQVQYMETHKNIDVLGTGYTIIDDQGHHKKTIKGKNLNPYDLLIKAPIAFPILDPTMMIRAPKNRQKPFYTSIPICTPEAPKLCKKGLMCDIYTYTHLILRGKRFAALKESLLYYRQTPKSLSKQGDRKKNTWYCFSIATQIYSHVLTGKRHGLPSTLFTGLTHAKYYAKSERMHPKVYRYWCHVVEEKLVEKYKLSSREKIYIHLLLIKQQLRYILKYYTQKGKQHAFTSSI